MIGTSSISQKWNATKTKQRRIHMDKKEEQAIYERIYKTKKRVLNAIEEEVDALQEVVGLLCEMRDKEQSESGKHFCCDKVCALDSLARDICKLLHDKKRAIKNLYEHDIPSIAGIKYEDFLSDEQRRFREYLLGNIKKTDREKEIQPLKNPIARVVEQMKKEDENKETNNN